MDAVAKKNQVPVGDGRPTMSERQKSLSPDAKGQANVIYPIKFGADPDWMTTSEITATVSHPEYIGTEFSVDPRDGKHAVTLKPGCQLTFSAVDGEGGEPVKFGIVMAGPGYNAKWIEDESGSKRSRAIPDGHWQTMLVSPRDNGRHLFSGVLPVRLRDSQAVSIRNIRLRPGLRVRGHLSDEVPRPIVGGKVVAHCLPEPAGNSWGKENPSISWQTSVDIQADGSFEFPSLPRGGLLQLIALCDGYVVVNTNTPEPNPHTSQGLFVNLDEYDQDEGVTIPMEPTGTVNVKVLRPDGKPLVGARVMMCPNHLLHLCGSTILGESWESMAAISAQLDPGFEVPKIDFSENRYSAKTNDQGFASIPNLPVGALESIYLGSEEFVIPSKAGGHDRRVNVTIEDTTPVDIVVKTVSVNDAKDQRAVGEALDAASDLIKGLIGG